MARGLTAAVPATLFGQTLTSESAVNIRSALFLMDFLLKRDFLVDTTRGYFTDFTITDAQGNDHARLVPNFDNFKMMVPKNGFVHRFAHYYPVIARSPRRRSNPLRHEGWIATSPGAPRNDGPRDRVKLISGWTKR